MKKIICDICEKEVDSVDTIELPIKIKKHNTGHTTEVGKVDICRNCRYRLKLENDINTIKIIKKKKKVA
jgi:hypothetical protein